MWMSTVLGRGRVRQLEAPHVVAKLRPDEQPSLGQRQQVPIDRCAIEVGVGEPFGQLGVTRRKSELCELAQNYHPLHGDADALTYQERPQVLLSEQAGLRCHEMTFPRSVSDGKESFSRCARQRDISGC